MKRALLVTGLLALAARTTVFANGGTVANMTTFAVCIVAAMGYITLLILD